MFLSARDLAQVGLLVADRGRWNERELIPADWLRASTGPQPKNYGYLWWIFGPGILAAGASANTSSYCPKESLVIVLRVSLSDEVAITRNAEGSSSD
jgi:CubicO group peptidase (beta-lactamase class C family)